MSIGYVALKDWWRLMRLEISVPDTSSARFAARLVDLAKPVIYFAPTGVILRGSHL
ncbi:MAG: hypothetical protein V4819_04810 [Verrucomicrobiota bacterium]